MLVFNLTTANIVYRRRSISPNGESLDFPDLSFIPDRDRLLEKQGILAFGSLPKDFQTRQAVEPALAADLPPISVASADVPEVATPAPEMPAEMPASQAFAAPSFEGRRKK